MPLLSEYIFTENKKLLSCLDLLLVRVLSLNPIRDQHL